MKIALFLLVLIVVFCFANMIYEADTGTNTFGNTSLLDFVIVWIAIGVLSFIVSFLRRLFANPGDWPITHKGLNTGGDGEVTGYKKLVRGADGELYSPQQGTRWKNGRLRAHEDPTVYNRSGIYVTKDPNDPELNNYPGEVRKIRGSGAIEHRRGYRLKEGRHE